MDFIGCEIYKKERFKMNATKCLNFDPENKLCNLCTAYSKKYKACYRKP